MSGLDGQTLVAVLIVVIACAALLRRGVMWWRGQSNGGCGGGCHGCGTATLATKVPLPIVEVDPLVPTSRSK